MNILPKPHDFLRVALVILCACSCLDGATVLTIDNGNNPIDVTPTGQGTAIFEVTESPTVAGSVPTTAQDITSGGTAVLNLSTSDFNYSTINGEVYVEFVINLNEPGNNAGSQFNIEELSLSSGGVSLWDLDADIDYTIDVNQVNGVNFNNGGNDTDVAIYIPVDALNLNDGDSVDITLGTSGIHSGGNPDQFSIGGGDGTSFQFPPIPEPSPTICVLLGTCALFLRRSREKSTETSSESQLEFQLS